ncbi:MAG: tRNA uridine-5-carboxymethylaminomethyl(34) synthesis GTPase MnmE [bacterium]
MTEDTIAAIATPGGQGGIGVIRVSGTECQSVISPLIDRDPDNLQARKATLCTLHRRDKDEPLDQGLITLFEAPRSYTGEQVVEISSHGSPLLLQTLLGDVLESSRCRLAEPGEFSRRAFENDKLDLAQADAVAGLIEAKSEAALKSSARQLKGELSETVTDLRETLVYSRSRVEAGLDFSDQDSVGNIPFDELKQQLKNVKQSLDELVEEGKQGTLLQQGCHTAIVGRPNVGKSSLLNKLLKNDRAIVTHQPGTTRDVISDQIEIGGIPFELFDTAGIRPDPESIEAEGIKRSKQALNDADLVLFMIDRSQPLTEADRSIQELISKQTTLLVENKVDLEATLQPSDIEEELGKTPDVSVSAKTGKGLDQLKRRMSEAVQTGDAQVENPLVTQTRHLKALQSTRKALQQALEGLDSQIDPTLIAEDLREASDQLAEITGNITTDDILDEIFSSFCIGK